MDRTSPRASGIAGTMGVSPASLHRRPSGSALICVVRRRAARESDRPHGLLSDTRRVRRASIARRLALGALLLAMLGTTAAPAAGPLRFRIQPEASEISFRATSRLMNAEGHFGRFSGDVLADPNSPAGARITLTIDAASLDTGIQMRDKHLRSADFFDVARFPAITFRSRSVDRAPAVRLVLAG